jgi:DNA modification methylase
LSYILSFEIIILKIILKNPMISVYSNYFLAKVPPASAGFYVLIFHKHILYRKPGENPRPVTKDPALFPVEWWQEVASPVWMTVDQGRVLNTDGARDHADERHICPLQLDVIERAITLWSNHGDLVYSPFAGIGSEGVGALKMGRRFVGSELKESYFKQAAQNLSNATAQASLFEMGAA